MAKIKEIQEIEDKELQFISGADMKKKVKGAGGRPKKAEKDKATQHILVNLTLAEKEVAEAKAKELGLSLSALAKIGLKKMISF
jgi:hypothetical protein